MRSLTLLCFFLIIVSCNQQSKFQFQFADQPQNITCSTSNNDVLNEALYSFEEDLFKKYDTTKVHSRAYARYILKGIKGNERFGEMVSAHSLQIRDVLVSKGIIINNGGKGVLDYNHPDVKCIINNIEDKDLGRTINALIQTNSMDLSLFDSRLRNIGRTTSNRPNQSVYLALDTYYKNLVGLTAPTPVNE